jgi:hypothetical protein
MSSFSAVKSAAQSIPALTDTKVAFQNVGWNSGEYDAANGRFTPEPGDHLIIVSLLFSAGVVDGQDLHAEIWRNGSLLRQTVVRPRGTAQVSCVCTAVVQGNGSDYFEAYAAGAGAGAKTIDASPSQTFFQGAKLA